MYSSLRTETLVSSRPTRLERKERPRHAHSDDRLYRVLKYVCLCLGWQAQARLGRYTGSQAGESEPPVTATHQNLAYAKVDFAAARPLLSCGRAAGCHSHSFDS